MILFLATISVPRLWAQTYKSISQARQAAASAKTQDALKAVLLSAILQLPVRDGVKLCGEYESKVSSSFRAELCATLGGLYLLLGETNDARAWYVKAASLDAEYLSEALRLSIATGDQKDISQLLKNEGLSEASRAIFNVWLSLYNNDYASASSKAKETIALGVDKDARRELLFLKYLADFAQFGAAQSTLDRDFPGSIESNLIKGKVFPPSWFVLSLGMSWLNTPAPLSDFQKKISPDDESKQGSAVQWLQAGYFSSKDNAERLSKTLTSKHFQTKVVEMKNESGEPRWAVQVAAEDDWQKTQSRLKDAGYESYLASP